MRRSSVYYEDKNFVKEIVEIDIQKDIDLYIEDFYFSSEELDYIEIPEDIYEIVDEVISYKKRSKLFYFFRGIVDILLVFILVISIVGIYKPKLFQDVDKVYPFLVRTHEFLTIDNLASLIGVDKSPNDRKNALPVVILNEADIKKPTNISDELKLIHSLANSLIKAERKWECAEVTPKTLKKALNGVKYLDNEYDRIYFRTNLELWLEGDFSNSVEVHNKVWEMLGGTVGEAYDLDGEGISEIKEKYFK